MLARASGLGSLGCYRKTMCSGRPTPVPMWPLCTAISTHSFPTARSLAQLLLVPATHTLPTCSIASLGIRGLGPQALILPPAQWRHPKPRTLGCWVSPEDQPHLGVLEGRSCLGSPVKRQQIGVTRSHLTTLAALLGRPAPLPALSPNGGFHQSSPARKSGSQMGSFHATIPCT